LNNIHTRLFFVILALVAGAAWVVYRYPTRKGLDIQGGMRVVLRAKTEDPSFKRKNTAWTEDHLQTVAEIMRNRVDALGVAEPVVYGVPPDRIVVELPGLKNKEQALEAIQSTASLEFRYVKQLEGEWTTRPEVRNGRDTGFEEILEAGKPVSPEELDDKVFSQPPIVDGAELEPNSKAQLGPQGYYITFSFRGDARRVFEEFTRSHIGKPLAVFLDKKLISAPVIEDVIPGEGIIRGRFTAQQAKTLAGQLNAGALPVPLEQLELTNVEATLGRQAVQQTTLAGVIGLVAVLLFMLIYYKVPGLLADIALILYTLFTFAVFKLIPVTLTVPGIAGFILSIGMAVDANILIFERFKEERLAGKSMRAAIEAGFKRAFTAIFDSNVCTLITCAILYHFGTGQVRGFAVTLAIGVAISMFTAITCSRTFLLLLAGTAAGQNDRLYPLGRGLHPNLQVSRRMGFFFALSGLIVVPGLVFWALGGIKPSIEFTGGTEMAVRFNSRPAAGDIASILRTLGHQEARVVMAEGNRAFVTTKRLDQAERDRMVQAFAAKGGTVERTDSVSGAISAELTRKAITAVVVASLLIVLYLAFRFAIPSFAEGLKFGVCAVAALVHDVGVLWGAFAIFGYFLNWQIDSLFVTALLTVIGFSVHDTIIIFDRIRENLHHKARGETFAEVADRSIEQTFARSINTSGTVVITLLALLIWGGPVIRLFASALLIGIVSGTYSSIFNATPLLVLWKRVAGERALAAAGAPAAAAGRPASRKPAVSPRPKPSAPVPAAPSAPANGPGAGAPSAGPVSAAASAERLKPKRKRRRM